MKSNRKYYFTVEGETERWYLLWLQKQINSETTAKYTVTLDCPIQKNPLKRAKSLVVTGKTVITHIFDYESDQEVHTTQFYKVLDLMKQSESLGKQIKYQLGYSNFTFELWMVLHKMDYDGSHADRKDYLDPINRAYEEHFESLGHYKHEANFNRILSKITLDEVKEAIIRSKRIMQRNKDDGLILLEYRGYNFYKENPSLAIWEAIEKILKDCKIIL